MFGGLFFNIKLFKKRHAFCNIVIIVKIGRINHFYVFLSIPE